MTKQKFPREGVQLEWFEGEKGQSWNGHGQADTQPLPPCARAWGPRVLWAKASGSLQHQWVWCNIWVIWSEAVPTLVDIYFLVPNLKAVWRPWPRGYGDAGRHLLSLQHPPSQIPAIHSLQPPACPLFLVNSLWTAFPLLPVSTPQKCRGLRRPELVFILQWRGGRWSQRKQRPKNSDSQSSVLPTGIC